MHIGENEALDYGNNNKSIPQSEQMYITIHKNLEYLGSNQVWEMQKFFINALKGCVDLNPELKILISNKDFETQFRGEINKKIDPIENFKEKKISNKYSYYSIGFPDYCEINIYDILKSLGYKGGKLKDIEKSERPKGALVAEHSAGWSTKAGDARKSSSVNRYVARVQGGLLILGGNEPREDTIKSQNKKSETIKNPGFISSTPTADQIFNLFNGTK